MSEFHLYCQIHLSIIILNLTEHNGSIADASRHIILFPSILVMATYFKPLCQNMGPPFTTKGQEPLPFRELNFEIKKKIKWDSSRLH